MAILSNVMEQGQVMGKGAAEAGKSILFAGLGAFSFVEEQSKKVVEGLIGKGHDYKKDELTGLTDRVHALKNNVKVEFQKKESVLEGRFQNALTGVLHHLGVPTKTEIRNLIQHVEELTQKVEELKKARG